MCTFGRILLIFAFLLPAVAGAITRQEYYQRWREYYSPRGKYQEAVPVYEGAVREYPGEAWFYVYLGFSLNQLRRYAEGVPHLLRARRLSPSDAGIRSNLRAGLLAGLGAFISDRNCNDGLALASEGAEALAGDAEVEERALVLFVKCGATDRAERLARSRTGADREIMLGLILLHQNRDAEAREHFARAIASAPASHEVEERIARAYRTRVEDLPYREQMASRYQDRVIEHSHAAVRKYFAAHPYRQTARYIPPLQGEFCLGQGAGGRSFHYGLRGHYSYDLIDCTRQANSTGMPVVAVADGVVRTAVFHHPDRAPGAPVDLRAPANYVRIEHEGGVFSVYVHLRQGSGRVSAGERVRAGQVVGQIGNSGVTTGPHLHFNMTDARGITLPATFTGLYAVVRNASGVTRVAIPTFQSPHHRYVVQAVPAEDPARELTYERLRGRWLQRTRTIWVWEFLANGRARLTQMRADPLVLHATYRIEGQNVIVVLRRVFRFRYEGDRLVSGSLVLHRDAGK